MKNTITVVLVLISLIGFSQNDAKSILDKVSAKTQSYKSITASFDFAMKNDDAGLNETSKGEIKIQDSKYHLSFNDIEIINDGETQWTFMQDAEEVTVSNAEDVEEGVLNPANIFTIYQKGFNNQLIDEVELNGKKLFRIQLTPIEEKEYSKVILLIDKTNFQIVSADMFADGNIYTILITSFKTTETYSADTFMFEKSKHPDIEVIDMR